MTAECGSATNLDRRHHTSLAEAQVAGVGRTPRLTMASEDIRHLQVRPEHVGLVSGRRPRLNVGEFEWALNLSDHVDGSPHSAARSLMAACIAKPLRHLNGIDQYGYCKRLGDRPG
jgi:hypothetical protein